MRKIINFLKELCRKRSVVLVSILCNLGFFAVFAKWMIDKSQNLPSGEWYSNNYRLERTSLFSSLPQVPNAIVFVGDSLIDNCEWAELLQCGRVQNRGIGAETAAGLLERISLLLAQEPAKLFLMTGINDLMSGRSVDSVLKTYDKLLNTVSKRALNTDLTVFSLLPTRLVNTGLATVDNNVIKEFNQGLRLLVQNRRARYMDLHSLFVDATGMLRKELTRDGVHLNGQGYLRWKSAIENQIGCRE